MFLPALSLCVVSVLTVPEASPEGRALAYLAAEVPAWSKENRCFSCHNNGDAARALLRGRRLGFAIPDALQDTLQWINNPRKWDHNGGDQRYGDKGLARIQFASALGEAVDAGIPTEKDTLVMAASLVAEHQQKDGSWKVEEEGAVGSPTTYGGIFATVSARRVLQRGDTLFAKEIARANEWLIQRKLAGVFDSAAMILALDGNTSPDAVQQRRRAREIIAKGQSRDGGWGPFVNSASEPFDTAIVVLALNRLDGAEAKRMLLAGRAYLLESQKPDGSWPETTRPAGGGSYAQRISTTAWATLALLETRW